MRFADISGFRFGRLVAMRPLRKRGKPQYFWECSCDCGAISIVDGRVLRRGHAKSCGCLRDELSSKRVRKHGLSATRAYNVWKKMLGRCEDGSNQDFADYGGRGITVCPRWHSFENFYADMGQPPPKLELDRVDNAIGYSKDNCRWSTRSEQMNNTRRNRLVQFQGKGMTLTQLSRDVGIARSLLFRRIVTRGLSADEAVRITVERNQPWKSH